MHPKISIIIPVYNGANYVSEAISSALEQTYDNLEIIVVNDGSDDNGETEKIVLSFGDKIRYIKKANGGVSTALNAGIEAAEGEWISWLSHDDLYTKDKIETQYKDLLKAKNEGIDVMHTLFYCDGSYISADGTPLSKHSKIPPEGYYSSNDILFYMFKGYHFGGCAFLLPKQLFKDAGYFDKELRYMQDTLMWYNSFLAGYGIYINHKRLSVGRIHNMQVSTLKKDIYLHDREIVGKYMIPKLINLFTSNNKSLLKQFMLFSCRINDCETALNIFNILKDEKKLNFKDAFLYNVIGLYGKIRPFLVSVYYKVRFNTKR